MLASTPLGWRGGRCPIEPCANPGSFYMMNSENKARGANLPDVTLYTTPYCPYCHRAKRLLEDKGVPFTDIGVMGQPELRREMEELSGGYTVPQIFIDGKPIGGSDELAALERAGKLDRILGLL